MNLVLSNLIREAHRREGFISVLVFGSQGIGKTSYALHVAHEIYGDWNKALSHLFFNPKDMISLFKNYLRNGERIPLVISDDAGLWLSKSRWWLREKVEFCEFFDIIRTVCSSIIFTTPSDNLLSRLSHEINLRVKISYIDGEIYEMLKREGISVNPQTYRIAKIYQFSLSPLFQPIIKKRGYDIYPLFYPDEIKEKYDKIRRDIVRQKLERVDTSLKSQIEIKCDKTNIDQKILELLSQGYSKSEIARLLGIGRATVYRRLRKLSQMSQ